MREQKFIPELPPTDIDDFVESRKPLSAKMVAIAIGGLAMAGGASVGSAIAATQSHDQALPASIDLGFKDEPQVAASAVRDEPVQPVAQVNAAQKTVKPALVAHKPKTHATKSKKPVAMPLLAADLSFGNTTSATQGATSISGNTTSSTQAAGTTTTTSGNTTNSTQATGGGSTGTGSTGGGSTGSGDHSDSHSISSHSDH